MGQKTKVLAGGVYNFVCRDRQGNIKWEDNGLHNLVTNEGLDHILSVLVAGGTQVNPWYVGLKGNGTVQATDTLGTHANWTEVTAYSGDRKEYVDGAVSSQSVDNSGSVASFSITGTATVDGAFLASAASGTTGTLLCAVDFTSARSVESGDTLEVTYTLSVADDGA